jgi:hypothetical protein
MNKMLDRVLVACPTYHGKHYALTAYLSAYNNFLYPHRNLFMVDNSGNGLKYQRHLHSVGVISAHIDPSNDFQETFIRSWRRITEEAERTKADWVASIEADNICPPLTLDTLLNVAGYCRALHVAHSYPWHDTQSQIGRLIGLGCNLISTSLLTAIFAQKRWYTDAVESEIFEYPKIHGYPTVEIHNMLDIQHLNDKHGAEQYIFKKTTIPELGAKSGEFTVPKYNKELEA